MTCAIPTREEIDAAVDNHKAIVNTHSNQTQAETWEVLNAVHDAFIKKDGFYETVASGKKLKTTITTKIGIAYDRSTRGYGKKDPKQEEELLQRADIGSSVHKAAELIGKELIDELQSLSVEEALKLINKNDFDKYKARIFDHLRVASDEFGFDITNEKIARNIFLGVNEVFKQIYNRQAKVNERTGTVGNVKIASEFRLIDGKEDMGGTADLFALLSNNEAMVFDFKTKVINKDNLNPDGTIKDASRLVSKGSMKNYKMQLGTIARILKKSYGVKRVQASRIVLISINVPFDAKTNKFAKTVKDVRVGVNQDPALQQIAPLIESTGFRDLDTFLKEIDKKIRDLEKKEADTKYENRGPITAKIDTLKQAKRDILTSHNFNTLLKYAQDLEKELTDNKIESMSVEETRQYLHELKLLEHLASATFKYKQQIKDAAKKLAFEETVGETIKAVADKIAFLEEELYGKKVVDIIETLSGRKITDSEGNVIPFSAEGYFGKMFNQLSQFENPVFIALRKKLDDIQYDIRTEADKVAKEVGQTEGKLFKWMDSTGKDNKWFAQTFIDAETDNLHNKLSKKFRAELDTVRKESDENPERIIEYYEPTENYTKWFEEQKKAKLADKKEYDNFVNRFNLALDSKGKPKSPKAWSYVLNKTGFLRVKPALAEANKSPEFKYIESIPEALAYYKMFEKYNKEFRDVLGVEYFNMPNEFLPNIRQDMLERMDRNGAVNGFIGGIKDMIANLEIREDDTMFGELEDGKIARRIPKFFINPFKNEDGSPKVGEKSYELGKSLVLFSKMAFNYKYMSAEEAHILAMREFMIERGSEIIKKNGKDIEDFVGNKLANRLGNTDLVNIFDNFVDMYLYGIGIQPAFGDTSMKWEKRIMLAKQYTTLKGLGLNFIASAGSAMAAKTGAIIEGKKGTMYNTKQYAEAVKESWGNREKHLAIVAYFDAMNMYSDNFNVDDVKLGTKSLGDPTRRGIIKKYVNSRMLMRPFSYGDEWIDELVTNAMAKNYYIDNLGNVKRMKNKEDIENYSSRSIWNLFSFDGTDAKLNIPEEQIKNAIIGFRRAVRAGQGKIKGTIPEEDKAYWQSHILGQVVMHYKSWMPGIMRERFGKVKYNDSIQAVEMGRYVALGKELENVEKYAIVDYAYKILLPKLGQFLGHLTSFGVYKLNDKKRKTEAFEKWLEENQQYKGIVTLEEFLDIQQRQLKALMIELRIVLGFFAAIMMLGADWDDDGEKEYKKYWVTRKLAAVLFKTNQELTFTMNPSEFAKMVANPIPMISLVTDAQKTLFNTIDEGSDLLFGEERMFGGQDKDTTNLFYYTHQWVPGFRGSFKLLDIFNNDSGEIYK